MTQELLDTALLPNEDDVKDISERVLVAPPSGDTVNNDSPMMGDDGILFNGDGILFNDTLEDLDEILSSLEELENHDDAEFEEMNSLLMEEDIVEEPTKEELEDPEDFLNNDEYVQPLDYERKLGNHDFHQPLSCNIGLEQVSCTSFKEFFDRTNKDGTLVIPCGECLKVDYEDGTELQLPHGLSINGKLYFDSNANITLRTKFVWVVGLLEIETPDTGKQVKFSLYGDELQNYTAVNPDSMICSNAGCNLGSKVIAVVGGKLDIKGAEDNCPAWEKLTNIGKLTPRPFENHLPCTGDICWENDTITLRRPCLESKSHTENLGKYTVVCPIESKNTIKFGEKLGIKLTSIRKPEPFIYPKDNGEELSLTINGNCGNAQHHSNTYGRCIIHCPLEKTAVISGGDTKALTFTSVAPDNTEFKMPSKDGDQVSLRLNGNCRKSDGHTKGFNRCAVMCSLFPTVQYDAGEKSGQLEFTSKYNDDPIQFPVPTYEKDGEKIKAKFILDGECVYMDRTSNAWGGCVVRCPVEKLLESIDVTSFHAVARLNNMRNNKYVNTKRIIQYAHGGIHMYLYLDDVSKDQCSSEGAQYLNNVFQRGDEIVPSYQISNDSSADGNRFSVDQIVHYSWKKKTFLFLPSDKEVGTCGETAHAFSTAFPSGYEVKVDYKNKAPGGETFNVDKVHHWAWKGVSMFFFPEESDIGTCAQTVSKFNSKFNKNFAIDVSIRDTGQQLGQTIVASKGVHHWSWNSDSLFFHPDQSADQINEKFPVGSTLKVDYLNAVDVYDIEVSREAANCWKPGTELLLTSDTRRSNDQQVRTIQSSNAETGILTLSEPIRKPITMADHEDFAIEVAPLNRRIVFEAESDSNKSEIGGHLIVHHTQSPQNIQGVEVRNFGQQGRLGRYPIHFHKCGDSPESKVRRNVVRNSNQRCYVVHMTNKITLEENVAYDAFGHCYFIEDGRETGNIFRKNLGSGVKKLPSLAVEELEAKSNRKESDGVSSVFWISNPDNYFYGNVAAGSEGHGYWFETHGKLRSVPLGAFVNNEVHSAQRFAFTTYSPGWVPREVGIIENLKVYRNPTWGAFLHVTQNLHFKGGLFADNRDKAVMISRGDDILFENTTFIGQTEFADQDCRNEKVAIHLDPVRLQETVIWNFSGNKKGTTVKNANFKNWSPAHTNCASKVATPLKFFSHQTFIKSYSAPHVFQDLNFDSAYSVDAIMPNSGIDDVQIEVYSDKYNALSTGGLKGFMISPKLESMVPTECTEYNEGLKFCPNTCIRTVTVLAGNSAFVDDKIDMIVRDQDGREIAIKKDVRGHPGPLPVGNRFFSAYAVALPKGTFQIRFEDEKGSPSWPRFAFVVPEAAPVSCDKYVDVSDFTFVKPSPLLSVCKDLIFNGGFESGKDGWYAFHFDIKLYQTGGINGSAALASTKELDTGNNIAQSLDGSCLEIGNSYDVSLTFKIMDYDGSNNNLPYVRLVSQRFLTADPARKKFQTVSAAIFKTPSMNDSGWTTISGIWEIDDKIANADTHIFHIGGGSHKVIIDNVSIQLRNPLISVRRRSL